SAVSGPEPAVHDLTAREIAEVVGRAVALLNRRGQGRLADRLDECLRRTRDREHLLGALADLRRRLSQAEDAHLAEARAAGRELARLRVALARTGQGAKKSS